MDTTEGEILSLIGKSIGIKLLFQKEHDVMASLLFNVLTKEEDFINKKVLMIKRIISFR